MNTYDVTTQWHGRTLWTVRLKTYTAYGAYWLTRHASGGQANIIVTEVKTWHDSDYSSSLPPLISSIV